MVTHAWRVARPRRTLFVAFLLLLSLTGGEAGSVVATPGGDLPVDVVASDRESSDSTLEPSSTTAAVVTSGSRRSGAVALTFDDGWNRSACASITRVLRARRARATFFINGRYLAQMPKRWARILRGMPFANHTYGHLDLVRQTDSTIRRELATNEAVHERVLGRSMLKMLRPPYGSYDSRVRRIASSLGYDRVVLWNVDTRDWSPSASVSSVVARATGARAGSIILMHCARSITADALPAIIRHYRSRGIRLVGLGRLLRR